MAGGTILGCILPGHMNLAMAMLMVLSYYHARGGGRGVERGGTACVEGRRTGRTGHTSALKGKKVRNGVERRQDEGRKDVSRPDYWYGGLTGDGKPLTAGSASRIRA